MAEGDDMPSTSLRSVAPPVVVLGYSDRVLFRMMKNNRHLEEFKMWKRVVAAVGSISILWIIIDWVVVHGILLRPAFESTAKLWKPMGVIEMVLGFVVTLVVAICFVLIYTFLVKPKSMSAGLKYGFLIGLLVGIWNGLGAYCVMPIPFYLAILWFIDFTVQMFLAGIITVMIIKE